MPDAEIAETYRFFWFILREVKEGKRRIPQFTCVNEDMRM